MTTLRIGRRVQYVNVDSRTINDDALSFRARGVLAWLLEKPDDWTVNAEAIAARGTEGRDAIRAALRELEAGGYIERRQFRADNGKWATECTVLEHPDRSGKPAPVNQKRETSAGFPVPVVNGSKEPLQPKLQPKATKPVAKRYGPEADALAKGEWARRRQKPVCGFPALRERIQEALDAGHSTDAVGSVLPSMPVFSRNAFDLALSRTNQSVQATTVQYVQGPDHFTAIHSDEEWEAHLASEAR